jgi:hypothetical protein
MPDVRELMMRSRAQVGVMLETMILRAVQLTHAPVSLTASQLMSWQQARRDFQLVGTLHQPA